MASQGPLFPTTTIDDATVGTLAWTNPNNVQADDGSSATRNVTNGNKTHYIKCTGFGFSIPNGSTINGIEMTVEAKITNAATNTISDFNIRLVKADTIGATNRANNTQFNNAFNPYTWGSSSDLWGDTWTPSDINNANFGCAFSAQSLSGTDDLSVDYISMTVYYTLASGVAKVMII